MGLKFLKRLDLSLSTDARGLDSIFKMNSVKTWKSERAVFYSQTLEVLLSQVENEFFEATKEAIYLLTFQKKERCIIRFLADDRSIVIEEVHKELVLLFGKELTIWRKQINNFLTKIWMKKFSIRNKCYLIKMKSRTDFSNALKRTDLLRKKV